MNEHISKQAVFEHWPIDDMTGERLVDPKTQAPAVTFLTFGKVSLSDLMELETHLRREAVIACLEPAEQARRAGMVELATAIIKSAVELGDQRRIGSTAFDLATKTVGGVAYLAFLSLRRRHAEITPSAACKIISDANEAKRLDLLQGLLFEATGFVEGKGQAAAAAKLQTNQ